MSSQDRYPRHPRHAVQALGALAALLLTTAQFGGVEALAQQRFISPHAQVVQLPRVVVTAQRVPVRPQAPRVAACDAGSRRC